MLKKYETKKFGKLQKLVPYKTRSINCQLQTKIKKIN